MYYEPPPTKHPWSILLSCLVLRVPHVPDWNCNDPNSHYLSSRGWMDVVKIAPSGIKKKLPPSPLPLLENEDWGKKESNIFEHYYVSLVEGRLPLCPAECVYQSRLHLCALKWLQSVWVHSLCYQLGELLVHTYSARWPQRKLVFIGPSISPLVG